MPYSPIDYQPVAYPLMGGADTKTSGLMLQAPKLQTVENAYVDQTGSIQRRFGRTWLVNTNTADAAIADSSFIATGTHQGRVLGFTNSKVYDYGSADARWADRGTCTSFGLETRSIEAIDANGALPGQKDMATLGAYKLYAYDYYNAGGVNVTTAFTLVDTAGTRYAVNQTLSTAVAGAIPFSMVKVVALGTRFYIIYYDVASVANMKCFIINVATAATLAASLAGAATTVTNTYNGIMDVKVNATYGPFIVWSHTTAPGLGMGFVNTSGALVNSQLVGTILAPLSLTCDTLGAALHGYAYTVGTVGDLYAVLYSFSGTVWTSTAASGVMDAGACGAPMACKFDSATVLRVWYASTLTTYSAVRQGTFSTAGTIATRVAYLPRSFLVARPFFAADGNTYYWVASEPFLGVAQPTLYLMRNDGTVVATSSVGLAISSVLCLATLPHVPSGIVGGEYLLITDQYTTIAGTASLVPGTGTTSAMREVTVAMQSTDSHVTVEDGLCTYIPGGFLQQYDGEGVTEVGFLAFVDTTNRITIGAAQITNGAGSLTNLVGTVYSYHVVPEWTNAQGEREQGTDSGAKTTLTGDWLANDDTVTFLIDCIPWTLKKSPRTNLVFAVYRTIANPTAQSPFYRVGVIANDPTADRVTFVDLMSDAVAQTQEQFYQGTGELDNVPPGSGGMILAGGNGRVFVAGFPEDPNLVMYSKARGHGSPLTFNDALTIVFPTATGKIKALAVLNDSLIAFCERAIYRVNGNGLNNTGTSGGYTEPILLATNDGAVGPRGVVTTPGGIMFDSSTLGISLVPPSMAGVVYIGAPMEKLADPGVCTGACVVPELQQVRFSFNATTHVFDYYHQQWYVFTHGSVGPTSLYNGKHVAIDTHVVVDDSTVYSDGGTAYSMTLTLGFVTSPQTKRGDLAIRSVGLTGVSLAAHYLVVYASFDQELTGTETVIDTSVSVAGTLEPKWRLARQRCSSIEVTIRDATLDAYGFDVVMNTAGMKLNELVFELGVVGSKLGRDE